MQATPFDVLSGSSVADEGIGRSAPELAIVVSKMDDPVERQTLLARIGVALPAVAWQLIVVADEADDRSARLAQRDSDCRLRLIGKADARGLSSDRVEGMLATAAPYVAVIGDDLRRDPALLAPMLRLARAGTADLVVVSRYLAVREAGDCGQVRARAGRIASRLASAVGGRPLSDPMSDSFLIRRAFVERHLGELIGGGAELLLDILLATRRQPPRVVELASPVAGQQGGGGRMWSFPIFVGRLAGDILRMTIRRAAGLVAAVSQIAWSSSPPRPRQQIR